MMIRVNETLAVRAGLITKIEIVSDNCLRVYTGETWRVTRFNTYDEAISEMNRLVSVINCVKEARDQC